jgi:TetR/AcrR family transcriptional repressor of nem operon
MSTTIPLKKKRGRPPRQYDSKLQTRDQLIRTGMDLLTEKGFINTGISELLEGSQIPKGSFYHYFKSKDAFGLEVLDSYGRYFDKLLDGYLLDEDALPLDRLQNFITGATRWIIKHEYRRGCLIGNVGQEASGLDQTFCQKLDHIFQGWQSRITTCLEEAQSQHHISSQIDCPKMAAFFWIGWEGAILRAKLVKSEAPLLLFAEVFFDQLTSIKPITFTNKKGDLP